MAYNIFLSPVGGGGAVAPAGFSPSTGMLERVPAKDACLPRGEFDAFDVFNELMRLILVGSLDSIQTHADYLHAYGARMIIPVETFFRGNLLHRDAHLPQCQTKLFYLLGRRLVDCHDNGAIISALARARSVPYESAMGALECGALHPVLTGAAQTVFAGNNILHLITTLENHSVLQALLDYVHDSGIFHAPCPTWKYQSIQSFLDSRGIAGLSPLHITCSHLDKTSARTLVAAGASTAAVDRYGKKPRQVAMAVVNEAYGSAGDTLVATRRMYAHTVLQMAHGKVDAVWKRRKHAISLWASVHAEPACPDTEMGGAALVASPARSTTSDTSLRTEFEFPLARTLSFSDDEGGEELPAPSSLLSPARSVSTILHADEEPPEEATAPQHLGLILQPSVYFICESPYHNGNGDDENL